MQIARVIFKNFLKNDNFVCQIQEKELLKEHKKKMTSPNLGVWKCHFKTRMSITRQYLVLNERPSVLHSATFAPCSLHRNYRKN